MDLTQFGFRPDFDINNKVVKQEAIKVEGKAYTVSTVDLGLDHSFGGGPPLYFETMIFPKDTGADMYCNRYTTREEALASHENLVKDLAAGKYEIVDDYFELKNS